MGSGEMAAGRGVFRRSTAAGRRWGVVATVREPVALIAAFALHHLALGAETVSLYFDDPDDPAADVLAGVDGVEVIRCTPGHWRRLHPLRGRPHLKTHRQLSNVRHAFRTSRLDWLAHIDADEFLDVAANAGPDAMQAVLDARPTSARWLRIGVAERIWCGAIPHDDLFGGRFRSAVPGGQAGIDAYYGTGKSFLFPGGMAGHVQGKLLAPVRPMHWPRNHEVYSRPPLFVLPEAPATGLRILHFEGLTERHWALKQLRQSLLILDGKTPMRPQRRKVTERILNAPDPLETAARWFHRTYDLPEETCARLETHGFLTDAGSDLSDTVATAARRLGLEVSVAAIDAAIAADLDATLATVLHRREARAA